MRRHFQYEFDGVVECLDFGRVGYKVIWLLHEVRVLEGASMKFVFEEQ